VLRCSAIFAERMRGINGKKLDGDEKVEQCKSSDFLQILQPYENRCEGMADYLFHNRRHNRQRTSTRSGILKAEADYKCSKTHHRFGITRSSLLQL
jgi:hypothetical protein